MPNTNASSSARRASRSSTGTNAAPGPACGADEPAAGANQSATAANSGDAVTAAGAVRRI